MLAAPAEGPVPGCEARSGRVGPWQECTVRAGGSAGAAPSGAGPAVRSASCGSLEKGQVQTWSQAGFPALFCSLMAPRERPQAPEQSAV